jgi:hypothetical protein
VCAYFVRFFKISAENIRGYATPYAMPTPRACHVQGGYIAEQLIIRRMQHGS